MWRLASLPEAALPVASSRFGEDISSLEEKEEAELEVAYGLRRSDSLSELLESSLNAGESSWLEAWGDEELGLLESS